MELKKGQDLITTGVTTEPKTFTWRIENFDNIRRSVELIGMQCVRFKAGETIGFPTEWGLRLQANTGQESDLDKKWVGIFLGLISAPSNVKEVNAAFEVIIRGDEKGTIYFKHYVARNFITPPPGGDYAPSWGCPNSLPRDSARKIPLTEDGSLLLEIEFWLYSPMPELKPPQVSDIEDQYSLQFSKKLQKDLEKMLTSPMDNVDAETKLISKDNVEFRVSRGVISARSPVFEKMFQADMEESKTGIVRISELSSKTISVLLRYIYTGTLLKDWNCAEVITELVYAADKYQFPDLVEFLNEVVGNVCCKKTAPRLIALARKVGMKKAEKDLLEYMKTHINTLEDLSAFAKQSESCDLP